MSYLTEPVIKKKYDEQIESFTLFDDFFMSIVFKGDKKLAEYVLRIILDKPGLIVKNVTTQDNENNLFGRSARFDILAEDEDGCLYHIEMQNADGDADEHRAGFYSAVMVKKSTVRGTKKVAYPENHTIFFTREDHFGDGEAVYRVGRYYGKEKKPFKDGIHIIYVNGAYRDEGSEIGRLIHDFHCSDPDKMYSDILADAVRRHKVDEEGRKEMCEQIRKIEEESRAEGRKEGRAEGRKEGRAEGRKEGRAEGRKEGRAEGRKEGRREGVVETLITLVCDGILSLKEAAERAGMTEDALRKRIENV